MTEQRARRADSVKGLAYSSGGLASTVATQTVATYVLFFYVDVMYLPARLAAAGMFAFGIWNALNDPLLGYVSDRTRTRFGRRIPYIAAGIVPLCLVFALLWAPPVAPFDPAAGTAAALSPLFLYFLIGILVFDSLYTLVFLNWTALFPEMFQSLADRARVGAWRQLFGLVGMVFGVALAPLVYGTVGWKAMGLIFSGLIALFGFISLWGSRERKTSASVGAAPPLVSALKLTFSNRSFVAYVSANFLVQFAFVLLLGAIPFYAKYVLGMDEAQNTFLLGAIFLTTLALLYPWSRWVTKWGARPAMIASLVGLAALMSPFAWVSGPWGGVATGAVLGVALAGVLLTVDVLIADVIDEDEVRVGVRREGMYYGVNAFVIRLGVSLQALVIGWVLGGTGYDPALPAQPESAIWGLRLLMTAVPMVALLLAAVAMRLYPPGGAQLGQVTGDHGRM